INARNENYYVYKLIKIDFLRRLKLFEESTGLIESLKNDSNFSGAAFKKAVNYQLELINKKDINEHKMPG
ncbi:MAG: hypothetical protein LBK13_10980, partial [Spirochaetales bacterium]|nr:hypothetical protein [Spirochaetales bacterium]